MEFRPKRSRGWAWLLALAFVMFYSAFQLGLRPGAPAWTLVFALPTAAIGAWALYLAVQFPTMRYELTAEELRLGCGPMCWRIPLDRIRRVRKADLGWTMWSSWRFPGFALFNVPCAGIGNVRMCSTRAAKGVTLVETAHEVFGISPADEDAFLAELARVWTAPAEPAPDEERAIDG